MPKSQVKIPSLIMGMSSKLIESYIKFAEANNLDSLKIEESGAKLFITRELPKTESPYRIIPTVLDETKSKEQLEINFPAKQPTEEIEPQKEENVETKYYQIKAPLVGTFYQAPTPGAAPFVKEGDIINSGQTLCIIEAMKVMNKINSEVKGKIVKISVENAQPVKQGDILYLVEPV